MKNLLSIFISSVFCFTLFGQNPTFLRLNQNSINPHSIRPIDGFQKNDSTYFAAFEAYFGAGTYATRFHEFNLFGDLIRELTPVTQSNSATVSSLSRVNDDIYLSIMNNGTCCYMFDKDYNIKWNNNSDYSCSIVPLNDSVGFGGCYFKSKNESRIAKLNLQTGDTIFTKSYQELLELDSSSLFDYSLFSITTNKKFVHLTFSSKTSDSSLYCKIDLNGQVKKQLYFENGFNHLFSTNSNSIEYVWIIKRDIFQGTSPIFTRIKILEDGIEKKELLINDFFPNKEFSFNIAAFLEDNKFYISIYEEGDNKTANYLNVMKFNPQGNLEKKIKYFVENEDFNINSFDLANDGGFFMTGECSYLYPENRAFIMKTDSNGLVESPMLFPLQIDTSLSDSTTNVGYINSVNTFSVYPNPVSSILNLLGKIENLKNIKLLDLKGSVLQSFTSIQTIDLLELRQGVYILEIETQTGEIERHKIIKK